MAHRETRERDDRMDAGVMTVFLAHRSNLSCLHMPIVFPMSFLVTGKAMY